MAVYGQLALDTANRQLRPFARGVVSDDVASEAYVSAVTIVAKFACVGAYDGLSDTDKIWFDRAVGVLTAITLMASAAGSMAGGTTLRKQGDEEIRYAVPNPDQIKELSKTFGDSIGLISCVKGARIAVAAGINVIGVGGRTRTREANGLYSLPRMIEAILPAGWGGDRRVILGTFAGGGEVF